MAQTNLIADTTLVAGQLASASVAQSDERVYLEVTVTEVVADSVVRLIVKNAFGLVEKSAVLRGTDTQELEIDGVSSTLSCSVECLSGSATVRLDRMTGQEGAEKSGAQAATADIADNAVTNAKIGAAAVDTTELAAGACTLPKFDHAGIKVLRFDGVGGPGPATLTGAVVGDRVLAVFGVTTATAAMVGDGAANFEAVITVDGQIQQAAGGDLSGNDYIAILIPAQA